MTLSTLKAVAAKLDSHQASDESTSALLTEVSAALADLLEQLEQPQWRVGDVVGQVTFARGDALHEPLQVKDVVLVSLDPWTTEIEIPRRVGIHGPRQVARYTFFEPPRDRKA